MGIAASFEQLVGEIATRIAREHGFDFFGVRLHLPPDFLRIDMGKPGLRLADRRVVHISGTDIRQAENLETLVREKCEGVLK